MTKVSSAKLLEEGGTTTNHSSQPTACQRAGWCFGSLLRALLIVGSAVVLCLLVSWLAYVVFFSASSSTTTASTATNTLPSASTYAPCNGFKSEAAPTGTISSGTPYQNNAACSWLLQPSGASPSQQLVLFFTSFQTESSFDVVRIYDGNSASATLLLEHSGNSVPSPVTGSGPVLFVQFTSDSSISGNGFVASYELTGASHQCSGRAPTFTADEGELSSGDTDYANGQNCSWLIRPSNPQAVAVELNFDLLDTERFFDRVCVYSGPDTSAQRVCFSGNYENPPQGVLSDGPIMLVTFVADSSRTARGFHAKYRVVTSGNDPCRGGVTLTDASDFVSFQLDHTPSTCSWLIQPDTSAVSEPVLELVFPYFNLNGGSVKVYDGASSSNQLLGNFDDSGPAAPILTSGGVALVTLEFSAALADDDEGFDLFYALGARQATCQASSTLTASEGTFSVIGYLPLANCQWLISPSPSARVQLEFVQFDTEAHYDVVRVYDGPSKDATLLLEWSGSALPPVVESSGSAMLVTFQSDSNNQLGGFLASYTSLAETNCHTGPLPAAKSGEVRYGPSTNNAACNWLITGTKDKLLLTFTEFDTETWFDMVRVYDGADASAPLLLEWSGPVVPADLLETSQPQALVTFTSDASVSGGSFTLLWDSVDAAVDEDDDAALHCRGQVLLTAPRGALTTGVPGYSHHQECRWLIQPAHADYQFVRFALDVASFGSSSAYVEVYDGVDTHAPLLGNFTGRRPLFAHPIESSAPLGQPASMLVRFMGGDVDSTQGLMTGHYWLSGLQCGGVQALTAQVGTFASGQGEYPANQQCAWSLLPAQTQQQRVELVFLSMDLMEESAVVCVFDGPTASAPLIACYTGQEVPEPVISTGSGLFVVFLSDLSPPVGHSGFTAVYSAYSAHKRLGLLSAQGSAARRRVDQLLSAEQRALDIKQAEQREGKPVSDDVKRYGVEPTAEDSIEPAKLRGQLRQQTRTLRAFTRAHPFAEPLSTQVAKPFLEKAKQQFVAPVAPQVPTSKSAKVHITLVDQSKEEN